MSAHKTVILATDIDVFFCYSYGPWEHGSNENTNRLIKPYPPKGIDLSVYNQAK